MANKKTITKVTPLNSSFLKEVDKIEKQIEKLTSATSKRHFYIVTKIVDTFNFKNYKCISNYFGDLDHLSILEDDVILYRYNTVDSKDIAFQIDGEGFPLCEYYPTKWLFSNFEKELELIKIDVDNRNAAAKQKMQDDKNILQSIKKKLTAEEYDFLIKKIS